MSGYPFKIVYQNELVSFHRSSPCHMSKSFYFDDDISFSQLQALKSRIFRAWEKGKLPHFFISIINAKKRFTLPKQWLFIRAGNHPCLTHRYARSKEKIFVKRPKWCCVIMCHNLKIFNLCVNRKENGRWFIYVQRFFLAILKVKNTTWHKERSAGIVTGIRSERRGWDILAGPPAFLA